MRDGDGEAHASVDQLDRIVDELGARASSRQAVLYVGRPWETCTDGLPCTSTIQFLRRLDGLHCVVSMRSWDLILGLPYDLMMFGGLQQVVAGCLGESLGDLIVTAGSAHVYLPAGAAYEIHECDQRFRLPIEGRLVDYRAWVADALLGDWVETPGGTPPEVTIERLGAPTPV
jgi:thymidylate synthase